MSDLREQLYGALGIVAGEMNQCMCLARRGEMCGTCRDVLDPAHAALRVAHDLAVRVQQIVDNYDALDYRKQRAVNIAEIIHQLREALEAA